MLYKCTIPIIPKIKTKFTNLAHKFASHLLNEILAETHGFQQWNRGEHVSTLKHCVLIYGALLDTEYEQSSLNVTVVFGLDIFYSAKTTPPHKIISWEYVI